MTKTVENFEIKCYFYYYIIDRSDIIYLRIIYPKLNGQRVSLSVRFIS